MTSPTCSSADDKSKYSHEIIVIKIEESLNFLVKIKLYGIFEIVEQVITWFGSVYAFHKPLRGLVSVNCPKSGYIVSHVQQFQIFLKCSFVPMYMVIRIKILILL